MRISPNHSRLRVVSLACWATGAYCLVRGGNLSVPAPAMLALTISTQLLALLLLALGVAFWLLSADSHAGVVFDSKGLLLNLGSSSSFIAWENIERVGVSSYRAQLLALGSKRQFGIALRDGAAYAQSYEARIPAARGPIARSIRLLSRLMRPFRTLDDRPLLLHMAANRTKTGFDVLVPETFLGGRADSFAELVEAYRANTAAQRFAGSSVGAR